MSETKFSELDLLPEIARAIGELGFEYATDIQAQAIPLMRTGIDLIGRSQTGTGKTFAFAIPALEKIDTTEKEPTPQVLILCPTRELAQQGIAEIKKLTRFMLNIWPVDVYGGAPIDRQIARLRRCNLVIGTPGRVMDHMRRETLSLKNIKLVVLDEADEMLSMGFREDIETILKDVPEERQTVLFSATMPQEILDLTETYQNDPQVIEVNREQVTLDKIDQKFCEVPMGRKLDALLLLLHAYDPKRCMLFCNTKLMVDECAAWLNKNGFTCEAIHGDMNQSQRTRVMEGFKSGRLPILVCTDVAARGIDVSDVDYVINYDIPQNSENYVHRIGRTGRAGKEGTAITISSGRGQFNHVREIARETKSEIKPIPIPTVKEIRARMDALSVQQLQQTLLDGVSDRAMAIVTDLLEKGYDLKMVAAAAFDQNFKKQDDTLKDIAVERKSSSSNRYRKLILSVGRRQKVAPNHIVSAIAEGANVPGAQIGKIEIYDDQSIVGIPDDIAEAVLRSLEGLTICGVSVSCRLSTEPAQVDRRIPARPYRPQNADRPRFEKAPVPVPRGKVKLSAEAKARLLDTSDLSRFEIGSNERKRPSRFEGRKPESRYTKGEKHGKGKQDRFDKRGPQRKHHC